MIISISGDPGSGKSSVGKAIAQKLGLKYYSAGIFMRRMAEDRGISMAEVHKLAENNPEFDTFVDDNVKKLAGKEDNFIIDSRIAFHFIPTSVKIFLKTDTSKAAERILRDLQNNKRATESESKTFQEVFDSIKKRQKSELERYVKYYKINHLDMKNYDIVVDATNMTIQQEIDAVMGGLERIGIRK